MRSLKRIFYGGCRRLFGAYTHGYARVSHNLPPRVAGPLDWYLLPKHRKFFGFLEHDLLTSYRDSLGGPFNGQQGRVDLFHEILKCIDFRAIVETGTFQGTSTLFMRRASGLPVYTVEAVPRNFYFAKQRLRADRDIHQEVGDSRAFLERLGRGGKLDGNVLFYLDAHWKEDLPLYEELRIIDRYCADPVVMIDDFEVPDDPDYGFDDYGPGKRLAVSCMPDELMRDFCLFWPSMRGQDESGLRRGCVVMCRPGSNTEKLARLPVLRMNYAVGQSR